VQTVALILLWGREKRTNTFTALIIPRQCPLVLVVRILHTAHKLLRNRESIMHWLKTKI